MNDIGEAETRLNDKVKKFIESECGIDNVDGHYWNYEFCIRAAVKKMCERGDCPLEEVNSITYEELREFFLPDTPKSTKEKIFDNLLEKAEDAARMIGRATETESYGYFDGCKLNDSEERFVDEEGNVCGTILDGYLAHVWKWKDKDIKWVYSEGPGLGAEVMGMRRAETLSEKTLVIDRLIHKAHGSGYLAEYFIEGGRKTLDKLKEE